jgi:hypothetical protein
MTGLDRRAAIRWATLFVVTLLVGGWPWPGLRPAFSRGYAAVASPVFESLSFGRDGRAALVPETAAAVAGPAVEQDARLALTVSGYEGELSFGLSLRRDAYLPTLMLLAALAGAPLAGRRKLLCLLAGAAAMLVLSLLCVWLTAAWLFSSRLGQVYQAGPAWRWTLDLIAGSLLLPPSNRFVAPLVLAAALLVWARRPSAPTPRSHPPPPAPAGSGSPPRAGYETPAASAPR